MIFKKRITHVCTARQAHVRSLMKVLALQASDFKFLFELAVRVWDAAASIHGEESVDELTYSRFQQQLIYNVSGDTTHTTCSIGLPLSWIWINLLMRRSERRN